MWSSDWNSRQGRCFWAKEFGLRTTDPFESRSSTCTTSLSRFSRTTAFNFPGPESRGTPLQLPQSLRSPFFGIRSLFQSLGFFRPSYALLNSELSYFMDSLAPFFTPLLWCCLSRWSALLHFEDYLHYLLGYRAQFDIQLIDDGLAGSAGLLRTSLKRSFPLTTVR